MFELYVKRAHGYEENHAKINPTEVVSEDTSGIIISTACVSPIWGTYIALQT